MIVIVLSFLYIKLDAAVNPTEAMGTTAAKRPNHFPIDLIIEDMLLNVIKA